ncbi:MAG: energy-coupling factor transporter transmembrane component T [Holophaga sp.]|nr:energy-coupling factor transporter transmembrane component T [Holophaga sp.]
MPLPDWLLSDQRYVPRSDREAFLDRSILSFLGVLAMARPRNGKERDEGRMDPVVKVVSVFIMLLLVSLTRSMVFLALAGCGLLVVLALQPGGCIAAVLKTSLLVGAFTGLVLLPSIFIGNGSNLSLIMAKVMVSVASVKLVSATLEWASISGAFKRLGAPDLFILVLDITLKYISLLGEFALSMLFALKLRSVGKNSTQTASLSAIAGTMFLTSKEMAEEMYAAMECRGFTGTYRAAGKLKVRAGDLALGSAVAVLVVAFFFVRT